MEILRYYDRSARRYYWAVYCQFRGYIREELDTMDCAEEALQQENEALGYDD